MENTVCPSLFCKKRLRSTMTVQPSWTRIMPETEADTCRKYVLPKLYEAGWTDDQINEQHTFTDGRKENERAWKVKASDVIKKDDNGNVMSVNLDIKNPNAAEALEHKPPEELVESILAKERRIVEIMGEIKAALRKGAGK